MGQLSLPSYLEYRCKKCGESFFISSDDYQKFRDVHECPKCGATCRRTTHLSKAQKEFLLQGTLNSLKENTPPDDEWPDVIGGAQ